MNPILPLVGLFGATLVVGVYATTTPRTKALTTSARVFGALPAQTRLTGVRAEYVADNRTLGQIDTKIVIQNTDGTQSIRLLNVYVLGRDGVNTLLRVYGKLVNRVIPPLGQVELAIDSSIGLRAGSHAAAQKQDVASVVVGWQGPEGSMKLTAIIQQWERSNSTDGFRGTTTAHGYDVPY